jgi:hypothetical protein
VWINIFNRREVFLTRDMNEVNRIKGLLTSNSIVHITRVNSGISLGRSRGSGVRADYAYEYRIYVHKDDLTRARHAIGR